MNRPAASPALSLRLSPRVRAVAAGGLLLFGVQLWLVVGHGYYGSTLVLRGLLAALAASVIPPITRRIARLFDRLRRPPPRMRVLIAAGLAVFSAWYFHHTAVAQQRPFVLEYVDEYSYALGAQMAAHGHLWLPAHPLADFFEALEILVRPIYASMYFPGAALLYAPAVWFGWPHWYLPLVVSAACVGLTYRIIAELIDGLAGLLAAGLLIGNTTYRLVSIMLLSQTPALLMILLAWLAWLRWRRTSSMFWSIAIGFFASAAAITRPLDAAALLLPVGLAIFRRSLRRGFLRRTALAAVIGALPLLALQGVFNCAASGSVFRTPFAISQASDYPQTALGFHRFDAAIRPASTLAQKQAHYDAVVAPALQAHEWPAFASHFATGWLSRVLDHALPQAGTQSSTLLLVPLPLCLLGLRRRRWVFLAATLFWIGGYCLYVFSLPHYPVTLAPFLAGALLAGVAGLARAWPHIRGGVVVFSTLALAWLSVTQTAGLDRLARDEWAQPDALIKVDQALARLREPSVVLFTFGPGISSEVEPVYNIQTPWPDDARVIRAHDLGGRDIELFRYYASRQPQRQVYRYDRTRETLTRLGTAAELSR